MSFLGMGTMEILIILLVAFIFLGPERMVDAAKVLGKWTGELRRMGSTVQAEMDDLTNVNAPLSSRYNQSPGARQPSDAKSADAAAQPLDQDHPEDPSTPAAPVPHSADGKPVRSEPVEGQASRNETQPTRREESA